ncbi:MAG: glutamate-cysteine ligase family protein, partial [Frankia sp.]
VSVESLRRTLQRERGGEAIFDSGNLTGLKYDDGMQLALEHGGALEYSSAPAPDLTTVIDTMHETLEQVADTAKRVGLAILPGANLPFDRIEEAQWVPKPRGKIMRDFFHRIGDAGAWGPTVMALTLSTQVTLDYRSEDDLRDKLRMQVAASPVVAGMFVNSPFEGGEPTGLLSRRAQCWLKTDPPRCGVLAPALNPDAPIDEFIDWATQLPMIYRAAADGTYQAGPDRSFARLMVDGFGDGTGPTPAHWRSHLSQIWTDVRLRDTLELRAADGPAYPHIGALPALWVGLTYHQPSRDAAWNLLRNYRVNDFQTASREVIRTGLATRLGPDSVRELAGELIRLARLGLRARIEAGLEQSIVLTCLDPIEEVVASGTTFAERTLDRWDGDLRRDPARYVDAYRI